MATTARKKSPKVKTSAYDVAEHLRTPEEIAAYLDAWLEGSLAKGDSAPSGRIRTWRGGLARRGGGHG